jgi:hypothetical protein
MTSEKFTQLRNRLYSLLYDEIRKAAGESVAAERGASGAPAGGPSL